MFRFLSSHRVLLVGVLTGFVCLFPLNGFAGALPTGERTVGNATIEPAYNDFDGTFVYLLTPKRLAPLEQSNPINEATQQAVPLLCLLLYPRETLAQFNRMAAPGTCPDKGGVIA